MKVTSYALARPNYYDRQATSVIGAYESAAIAPHGATDRWTYTVGAGYRLLIENLLLSNFRATAASTSGPVYAYVVVSSGVTSCRMGHIGGHNTTVGDQKYQMIYWGTSVYAGESLAGTSGDYSTGGTTAFIVDMKATLFTA